MLENRDRISMVDLKGQYLRIKAEMDAAMAEVVDSCAFVNGPQVKEFASDLAQYAGSRFAVTCANGTDALQIALMAAGLVPGDEVIVPAFTYVASAEVIALLGLTPVMVDVDRDSFNVTLKNIERGLTSRTRAVIPVHLFGQSCDMEPILGFAREHRLLVIEDNAQAIGALYRFRDGRTRHTGTMGAVGCTSFFPSKNLGCYGDGGAMLTDDAALAERLRMIANHGQQVKYHHKVIGCNSRLDTLQAAVLKVKLRYLDSYCEARRKAADYYRTLLKDVPGILLPETMPYGTHVFHQFTLKVQDGKRDALKNHLQQRGIPSMVYYPLPLNRQEAFSEIARVAEPLTVSASLAESVLSLPMHTELTHDQQERIAGAVMDFYKR